MHAMSKFTQNATLLALTTALISGVSVFVNKFAVGTVSDPILFSAAKNALVAVLLVGIVVAVKQHKEWRTLSKKQWGQLGLIGLVGGALPFALFFSGLALIPAASGALIHKTFFIWVALLAALFLHERLNAYQWLGVGALLAANIVVGGFTGFSGSLGELLVLGATLLWAFENIVAKRALGELSALTVASGRMVFGALFLLAFLTMTGRVTGLGEMSLIGLGWTLLTAVFLLGYVVTWYSALKRAPASYVAALLVPAALITNVLSAVFITGALSESQVLAGFLMVLGATFVILYARKTGATLSEQVTPTQAN